VKHERPPDEAWWERELHRNEKMTDRYLAVLADNPELSRLTFPGPPEEGVDAAGDTDSSTDESAPPGSDADSWDVELDPAASEGGGESDTEGEEADHAFENDPPDNEGYPEIARQARALAVALLSLEGRKEIPEILVLSGTKIGANLAGGHGLGYDEDTLCGNIVKCRWALADCEFCRELLEQLARQTGHARYRRLQDQSAQLAAAIRQRIARLRARVWW
jgi:hypothetical protein